MIKTCRRCGAQKPTNEFGVNKASPDGLSLYCKPCVCHISRQWRENNPEKFKEKCAKSWEKRRLSPSYLAKKAERQRLDRKMFPQKHKARRAIECAIRKGTISKLPCVKCGNENTQAHHPDYSKPLDVEWMCQRCHLDHHQGPFSKK